MLHDMRNIHHWRRLVLLDMGCAKIKTLFAFFSYLVDRSNGSDPLKYLMEKHIQEDGKTTKRVLLLSIFRPCESGKMRLDTDTFRATTAVVAKMCIMQKVLNFAHFNSKNTSISLCKNGQIAV